MNKQLSTTTQLFIRATKVGDSIKRLHSVYRRLYLANDNVVQNEHALVHLLSSVVDEVAPIKISRFFQEVASYKSYNDVAKMMKKDVDTTPEHLIHLYVLRDHLRRLSRKELNVIGVRQPAYWRNK